MLGITVTSLGPDMSFTSQLILNFLNDVFKELYSYVGFLITDLYEWVLTANQTSEVAAVCLFTMMLGSVMLGVMVCKHVAGTYGLGTSGDPDQDPVEIIFKVALALGFMGGNSFIFNELLKFTIAVAKDVMHVMNNPGDIGLTGGEETSFAMFVMKGILVFGVIAFSITVCIRSAEITLSKVLLPIFAVDLINSNSERWNMFIFQYGMSFLGFVIQIFCYEMFVIKFGGIDLTNLKEYFVAIGWLVLAIKTPSILEKYVYATGTGRAISNGASRLSQVVMYCGMRM